MEQHQHTEKCREVAALLSEYLNLDLPPDACREIESHLADCSPCVDFAESLRQTVELCRSYEPSEFPAPLGQEAREKLLDAYRHMLLARKPSP